MPPLAVRTLVHRKLDEASDAEVVEIHRILLEMEARRLWGELSSETAADWQEGRLTGEGVDEAVHAHRAAARKP